MELTICSDSINCFINTHLNGLAHMYVYYIHIKTSRLYKICAKTLNVV